MIWNKKKDVEGGSEVSKGELNERLLMERVERPMWSTPKQINHNNSGVVGSGSVGAALSTIEEIFALTLQNSINPSDPNDQRVWTYNVPSLSANERRLALEITGCEVFILNIPTADFPNEMYLFCDTLTGYLDNNGDGTHIVAILRIRQLVPCISNGIVSYTIIYSAMDQITWDLGTSRVLNFTFGDANSTYIVPLAQAVQAELKITHICY